MRNRGSLYKNYECDIDSSRFRPPEAPNTRFGLNTLPHGFDRKIRLNGHYVIAFVSPLPTSVVIRGRFPIFEASCFSNRYKLRIASRAKSAAPISAAVRRPMLSMSLIPNPESALTQNSGHLVADDGYNNFASWVD